MSDSNGQILTETAPLTDKTQRLFGVSRTDIAFHEDCRRFFQTLPDAVIDQLGQRCAGISRPYLTEDLSTDRKVPMPTQRPESGVFRVGVPGTPAVS